MALPATFMKPDRSARWLLLTFTPLLMSVQTQQTTSINAPTAQRVSHRAPASMSAQQQALEDNMLALLQQVGEKKLESRSYDQHTGGCLYGTGNIALSMTHIVKE